MINTNRFYEKLYKDKKTGKTYYKPKKFLIYTDNIQKELYKFGKLKAIRAIKRYNSGRSKGRIVKANAFGSFLHRKMGVYWTDYKKVRLGSDIDLACIVEKGFKAPSNWKKIGDWQYITDSLDKYIPEINIVRKKIPFHPINFIIFEVGRNDFNIVKNWIALDESYSKKKGYLVETWFFDKKRFNKIKGELK
jgi:hypothetical protein